MLDEGFSVLLGPPLSPDCNLMNQWIVIGNRSEIQLDQLYQISYYCPSLGFASAFTQHLADSRPVKGSAPPPLAAVSVEVQRRTRLKSLLVYLLYKGWRRVAIYYEIGGIDFSVSELQHAVTLTLSGSKIKGNVLDVKRALGVKCSDNFTDFVIEVENIIDGKRLV